MLGRALTIGMVCLTAGCASESEVAATPPAEVVRSDKSQQEVVNCLNALDRQMTTRVRDDAVVVFARSDVGLVGTTFTVTSEGGGSRVEIRQPEFGVLISHRSCY
jgi:hypothetical protein